MPTTRTRTAGRLSRPAVAPAAPVTPVASAQPGWDVVDEWGAESFPASDPPANW